MRPKLVDMHGVYRKRLGVRTEGQSGSQDQLGVLGERLLHLSDNLHTQANFLGVLRTIKNECQKECLAPSTAHLSGLVRVALSTLETTGLKMTGTL